MPPLRLAGAFVAAVAVCLLPVSFAQTTADGTEQCTPQGGTYEIASRLQADTNAQLAVCNIVKGNVDITCSSALAASEGEITSLDFLKNVHTIDGWLRIQDCPSLSDTLGLANLRLIRGTPDRGLVIWNNDKLESIKGLEDLPTNAIEAGGVSIFHNDALCYVDLMKFERVVVGSSSSSIKYAQKPASCLGLECDAACTCSYCAGPGACKADCSAPSLGWVAAPVLIALILLGLLIWWCWRLKKEGELECQCYCSHRPQEKSNDPSMLLGQLYPTKPISATARPEPLSQQMQSLPPPSPAAQSRYVQNPNALQQLQPTRLEPVAAPSRQVNFSPPGPAPAFAVLPGQVTPESSEESGAEHADSNCHVCGKVAEFDCSRCNKVSYCSSECQRADWKSHREACKNAVKAARMAQTAEASGAAVDLGVCAECGKPAEFECSRCGGPAYCSATCQRTNWRQHAPECKKRAAAKSNAGAGTDEIQV